MKEYSYNGISYPIKVIKKDNKNTYLRVKNGEIIVTTTYFTPQIIVNKLIKDNETSLIKMIEIDQKKCSKTDDINKLSLFQLDFEIVYGSEKMNIINNTIYVKDKKNLDKFILKYINKTFSEHLDYWYNKFEEDIPFPNLKIRKMTSRWGVCNLKNNNVTLNYELHNYDLTCLDYVIVHELSHFQNPNHSASFWKQVGKYYPDYKGARKKLREY